MKIQNYWFIPWKLSINMLIYLFKSWRIFFFLQVQIYPIHGKCSISEINRNQKAIFFVFG